MLRVFNTDGRRTETFRPANRQVVGIFTCGPSVYQRAHIGNFRTFLFEDVLVRYLEYCGYTVRRGMNITDVEDKAIETASKKHMTVRKLTDKNLAEFVREMKLLRIKTPDYLPRASETVREAVDIIEDLVARGVAYWHGDNVYFDPLKFPGFGKLYGLDMSRWPREKKRFHKDTYPGNRWNLGDFILWHGYREGGGIFWKTRIGKGRPSWNIQDPAMISRHFNETLSVYCGGIDNLYRHHDYTLAVLESVRPYPMAKFWLHCRHLYVDGKKMSKSKGNIYYTDTLKEKGYIGDEIRFFLIYGHYRERLDYSDDSISSAARKLRSLRALAAQIEKKSANRGKSSGKLAERVKNTFMARMDDDLDVRGAFDAMHEMLSGMDLKTLEAAEAYKLTDALRGIDKVLQVIF